MINPFKSKAALLLERGLISEAEYIVMRSDGRFSRAIVVSAVAMISFYAAVMMQFVFLNIENHTSVFPPVEFTTGYFAFWTVEIVMLSSIKNHKIKNKYEDDTPGILQKVLERTSKTGKDEEKPGDSQSSQPVEIPSPDQPSFETDILRSEDDGTSRDYSR